MSASLSDLSEMCRFCLKGEDEVGELKVIELETIKLFFQVTQTRIANLNELSEVSCANCRSNLVMYFQFKQRLIRNQRELKKLVLLKQSEELKEVEAAKIIQEDKPTQEKKKQSGIHFVPLSEHLPPSNVHITSSFKTKLTRDDQEEMSGKRSCKYAAVEEFEKTPELETFKYQQNAEYTRATTKPETESTEREQLQQEHNYAGPSPDRRVPILFHKKPLIIAAKSISVINKFKAKLVRKN